MESLINATAGGVAAVCSTTVLYPLDVILVRYQTASGETDKTSLSDVLMDALRRGPLSVYRGLEVKMLESLVKNFVYFYWYDFLKRTFEKRVGKLSTMSNLGLATLAGILNQLMTAPFEVITTNIQTSDMSVSEIINDTYKNGGLKGFYRGFMASMVLCSNPAITNTSFDRLKQLFQIFKFHQLNPDHASNLSSHHIDPSLLPTLTAGEAFLLGAMAKAIATLMTYPYIRVKALMQKGTFSSSNKSMPDGSGRILLGSAQSLPYSRSFMMSGEYICPVCNMTRFPMNNTGGNGSHHQGGSTDSVPFSNNLLQNHILGNAGMNPQLSRANTTTQQGFLAGVDSVPDFQQYFQQQQLLQQQQQLSLSQQLAMQVNAPTPHAAVAQMVESENNIQDSLLVRAASFCLSDQPALGLKQQFSTNLINSQDHNNNSHHQINSDNLCSSSAFENWTDNSDNNNNNPSNNFKNASPSKHQQQNPKLIHSSSPAGGHTTSGLKSSSTGQLTPQLQPLHMGNSTVNNNNKNATTDSTSSSVCYPGRYGRCVCHTSENTPQAGIPDTALGMLVSILMREGPGGVYKGLGLQLLKTMLGAALMFMVKDSIESKTRKLLKRVTSNGSTKLM